MYIRPSELCHLSLAKYTFVSLALRNIFKTFEYVIPVNEFIPSNVLLVDTTSTLVRFTMYDDIQHAFRFVNTRKRAGSAVNWRKDLKVRSTGISASTSFTPFGDWTLASPFTFRLFFTYITDRQTVSEIQVS